MILAASDSLPTEVLTTLIAQIGILLGVIASGVFSIIAAKRSKKAEQHSAKAAEDASVVREETRNSHSPDRPLRHDMDQILANQANDRRDQELFQAKVLSKLEGHDRELSNIRKDGTAQWEAINSVTQAMNHTIMAASATVRAAERTVTEAVKITKE